MKTRGFTLVEIMVVIAVMGLLIGIAVPSFKAFRDKAPLESSLGAVEDMCRRARAEAILKKQPMQLTINEDERFVQLTTAPRVVGRPNEVTGEWTQQTEDARELESAVMEDGVELEVVYPDNVELGEPVVIRFLPNGTAEDLVLIVRGQMEAYSIKVDPVTAVAEITNAENELGR